MYSIIEDCSPYYIRFTYPMLTQIINRCQDIASKIEFPYQFAQHKLDKELGQEILDMSPMSTQFELNHERVSLLVSKSGHYGRVHKDGIATHISFNYPIKILDDKCITSWFSDEDMKDYQTDDNPPGQTGRRLIGCDTSKHCPLKTMCAKPNEAVLFNTEIWHDFDNRLSANERIILTLRPLHPENIYFEDARKIMFGF
jgi:hypothetical protein